MICLVFRLYDRHPDAPASGDGNHQLTRQSSIIIAVTNAKKLAASQIIASSDTLHPGWLNIVTGSGHNLTQASAAMPVPAAASADAVAAFDIFTRALFIPRLPPLIAHHGLPPAH
jgi:hypothetical protein